MSVGAQNLKGGKIMKRIIRIAAALVAAVVATIGLTATANARDMAAVDYGSGSLGDWSKLNHCDTGCRGVDYATKRYVYSTSWETADVGIVGDSITGRGWGDLQVLLAGKGATLAINYWGSRPTAPAVDWLIDRINTGKKIPKVIIMATGSNDVYSPVAMTAQIRRLKAALPAGTELFWVDVQVTRWRQTQTVQINDQRNTMATNQQIWMEMEPSRVIRWAELFWGAPWRLTYYLVDGVHPSYTGGTRAWAATVYSPLVRAGVLA